ncbi:pectate lyase-like protein [Roseimicrobium gellanilyticum]|uniref:Pectate lyase-like protein n=1 Tax=Roseimicrobium gellanilyticum TaxID=748857 RepID=A0A366H5B4_9BACT|nr:glycosyl hydrolase family 28-related protein [Roseimicrobium gellanilyticum]RBP36067.1 pectate lyase-like protein [Roseimicrobium gellanilyticum]
MALLTLAASGADQNSELWGASGEKWTPASRLPDFSQAGYRRGEELYRIPKKTVSVKDLGAKGDGKTDDTKAFKKAISGPDKLVLIPKGRYVLSDMLEITEPRVVLRGAGPLETVLFFTRPLQEIKPATEQTGEGKMTSVYSWSGGLISAKGAQPPTKGSPVEVTAEAKRGDMKLTVGSHRFKVGDEVMLVVTDTAEQSLLHYLHRGQGKDIRSNWKKVNSQVFRVTQAGAKEITLDRGLRFDVKLEWIPNVCLFSPEVTDVGVEELGFEFPAQAYKGHWEEVGYNPIEFTRNVAHCWVRNVRVWNADSGPFISGWFCSVDGILFGADAGRNFAGGISGHHGVTFEGSDNLCTNFKFETKMFHDVTLQNGAMGNVFSKGSAPDFNMDHHKGAPYENLLTDIDAGEGTRLFQSGGAGGYGNHTAAGATFWNIRSKQPTNWPEQYSLDAMNLVAMNTQGAEVKTPDGRWMESIPPGSIAPADLHLAMRQKRLGPRAPATVAAAPPRNGGVQQWKSTDGRVIEAQFVGLQGDQVTLVRGGQSFVVPMVRLAPESQVQARNLAGSNPTP